MYIQYTLSQFVQEEFFQNLNTHFSMWWAMCEMQDISVCASKLASYSFHNIASSSVIQINVFKFEIVVLNVPFFVGFNWFCTLYVDHTMSPKLTAMLFWCCLPFLIAAIPMNVKCHFSIFQCTQSLSTIGWKYSASIVSVYYW